MQLGLSESARVMTAEESRFRVSYPNSRSRRSCIIALDEASRVLLDQLAETRRGQSAQFFTYIEAPATGTRRILPVDAVLEHLDGRRISLSEVIKAADIVVMVAAAGTPAVGARIIGNTCLLCSKLATALVIKAPDADSQTLTGTLRALRPFAVMLVVSSSEEYIPEMLDALRI